MAQLTKNKDYRLEGYFVDETVSNKGFATSKKFYKNYDEETKVFSNLKVREDITHTFDEVTGLVTKKQTISRWYKGGQEVQNKQAIKHYSAIKGYQKAQKGRAKLAATAGMTLMGTVGLANAQAFLTTVQLQRDEYIAGNREPLVTAIQASTEAYMTQGTKDALVSILDIDYSL